MINQFSQFTGIRAAETFFQPLQLHFELADLLEQLSLLGLACVLGLRVLAPGEKVAGTLQQRLLPRAHLDRVHRGVVGGNLLERLATTDRLHGDLPQAEAFGSGLELGAMGRGLLMGGSLTHQVGQRNSFRTPAWSYGEPPYRLRQRETNSWLRLNDICSALVLFLLRNERGVPLVWILL